ncbi:hypothetical protein MCAV_06160 [[Mycoplasma] cavipharyngis]|uniref:MPN338 family protein n=1 Tax=[Mycoplasma] cavipharyngis TaxID=92757 RepID=UPI0037048B94
MDNFENTTIKRLKLKEIFPFYISDINDKFFISLNNHPNKTFTQKVLPVLMKNLKEEDIEELNSLDNLTKAEKIKLMLNLTLKKIIAKTNGSKFKFFKAQSNLNNNPIYIDYMHNYNQEGSNQDEFSQIERRYNFFIDIDNQSYLHKYIQQIQLSFYLDEDNEILSGGFSLNYETHENISFADSVQKIYLRTLIRNFILKQLYPMSLDNIFELIKNYCPEKTKINKKSKTNRLQFVNITVNDIKNCWIDLIDKKYLNYINVDETVKKHFHDDLFFAIMTTTFVILSLYEELRIYFTSESPEIILGLLNKPEIFEEQSDPNPESDFLSLSKFLVQNYFSQKSKIDIQKVKTTEELIEIAAWANAKKGYESFGFPLPVYEFLDDQNKILISADSFFKENDKMKLFYLMTISPELFGMDEDSGHFIEYGQLLNVLATNKFTSKNMPLFYEKVQKTNCELNYNFATYLNEKTMLILKNEKVHVYHDYFWAQIYAQSINWIRKDIEFDFDNDLNPKKNSLLYQEKINTLENLIFDWQDEFYGISQIKHIVYKIDEINNLKTSIQLLIERINEKDHIYKKDIERSILIFAFTIAALIGFNNFFGMIYTILSVGQDVNLPTANIITIAFSAILACILVGLLSWYLIRFFRNKKYVKNKKGSIV